MTDNIFDSKRPPFVVQSEFILTAFAKRFQGIMLDAWQQRSWHVIAAIPGSGKSWGIHDLVLHSGAQKKATGEPYLPVLAIRAPMAEREQALGMAISAVFGVSPSMPWNVRRTQVIQVIADASVECIVIDDAQVLSLPHLSYLKELTDNLAAPPYRQQLGLCLVVANRGDAIPLKTEYFDRSDVLWRQFRRRMDTERPFCIVPGHTEDELLKILATFEALYRGQLPDLQLQRWAKSIFTWLTHPILDPDATRRVTTDHLTRFVTGSLRRAYKQGASDVDATILETMASLMIFRRDEIVNIDEDPSDEPPPPGD